MAFLSVSNLGSAHSVQMPRGWPLCPPKRFCQGQHSTPAPTRNVLAVSCPAGGHGCGIDGCTQGFKLRMAAIMEGSLPRHVSPS